MALPKLVATKYPNIRKNPKTGDYWVDAEVQRMRTRERVGPRLKDALVRLSEVRLELLKAAEQKQSQGAKKKKPREITLGELIEQQRHETEGHLRPRTAARYRTSDNAILGAFGEDFWVSDMQPRDVASFRAERSAEVAPATVNRDMQRLKALLDLAVRDKVLARNPLLDLRKPRLAEPEPRRRVLSLDEARRLRCACAPIAWLVVEFALRTGIRLSQILGLRWAQICEGHIWLDTSTKTARKRQVPITDKIQAILLQQRGRHKTYVFPGPAGKNAWNIYNFSEDYWRPALKRAGITDFKFHDLRHTWASTIRELGGDLTDVQDLGGWSDIDMARKYIHLSKPHLVTAMQKADMVEWGEVP